MIRSCTFDWSKVKFNKNGPRKKFDSSLLSNVETDDCLKRMLADLVFLSRGQLAYNLDDHSVIIISTKNTKHIDLLGRMFPKTMFYVYNPHITYSTLPKNVKFMGAYFDDNVAKMWADKNMRLILICDPRVLDRPGEEEVMTTMRMQESWVRIMKPDEWSVTARFPFSINKLSYLDGTLVRVPYSGKSSELRLQGYCRQAMSPRVKYDIREIEQVMFHFNTEQRNSTYDNAYFLYAVRLYANCLDVAAHPETEEDVIAYAERIRATLKPQ